MRKKETDYAKGKTVEEANTKRLVNPTAILLTCFQLN